MRISNALKLWKWSSVSNYMSIEPGYLCYFLSYYLVELVNMNLFLQKSCRNVTATEPDLWTPCDDEKKGVLFTTEVNSYYRTGTLYVQMIECVIFSAWSDRAGNKRKIFIVISSAALVVQTFVTCLQAYFWDWSPMATVWSEVIFQVGSGGFLFVAIFGQVYLLDSTSLEERTPKFAILKLLQMLSFPLSSGMSGFLMRYVGFFATYVLCFILALLSFILFVLLVHDRSEKTNISVLNVLSFEGLSKAFRLVFKEKPKTTRRCTLMLLMIKILLYFSITGEKSVFYLYFRYRFKWDEVMYSVYLGYKLTGVVFGTLFCSIVLSKMLKIHDGIIGTFASFWDTLAALAYIFATQTWQLYLIPLLDIFHGMALAVCDSFQSKFFESHEMGQLFSVHMFFNLLIPICIPAYNLLFKSTMDFFPASFFLISVPINVVICILYCFTYYLTRPSKSESSNSKS